MLNNETIVFNKPYLEESCIDYFKDALFSNKHSGNGKYTKYVNEFFRQNYQIDKCQLTTSCTDALEMASLLLDVNCDDEIILPSYTFVSTANAFALRGAKLVFCDSESNFPNIDTNKIEKLVTDKTKAIVVVHYAGFSCNMEKVMAIAKKNNLYVVEDAAQAIDNYYIDKSGNNIPLGTIGDLGTLSFHETKNISCGEGGLLFVNNPIFEEKSNIILEKGTNRTSFFEGKVNKYEWVGLGSSFLPSEFTASILYAQLQIKDKIKIKRVELWNRYHNSLNELQNDKDLMDVNYPLYSCNNAHMYFIVTKNSNERKNLMEYLKINGVSSVSHYLSLNKSPYYLKNNPLTDLMNSDKFSNCLLRLPMYYDLRPEQVDEICLLIHKFFSKK